MSICSMVMGRRCRCRERKGMISPISVAPTESHTAEADNTDQEHEGKAVAEDFKSEGGEGLHSGSSVELMSLLLQHVADRVKLFVTSRSRLLSALPLRHIGNYGE